VPTVQELLDIVNATYRNSYSTDLKVTWMNETQRQIYQTVRHETIWNFVTVEGYGLYPLPDNCDPMGVKTVNIETKVGSDKFRQLPFVNIKSSIVASEYDEFYTIEANKNLMINPIPDAKTASRRVFVFYNKRPRPLFSDEDGLTKVPDLERDFQELLVLGCLERICRARGEYDDKSMFSADYEKLFKRYKDMYDNPYPEYKTPIDVLPRRQGQVYVKGGQNRYPYGLLPSDLN